MMACLRLPKAGLLGRRQTSNKSKMVDIYVNDTCLAVDNINNMQGAALLQT
jgi:hypothetical protein